MAIAKNLSSQMKQDVMKKRAVPLCFSISHILKIAILLLLVWVGDATAATCQSTGSGNWSAAGTWTSAGNCNHVPATGDTVTILNTHTVTLDTNSNPLASLTVNAGGTLTTAGSSGADLYLSGNLVNNGTINMQASSGTNTIYLTGSNLISTFSGTGIWLLDNLDLNGNGGNKCTGASGCKVELSGSPDLQFVNSNPFSGNSNTFTFNAGGNSTATVAMSRAGAQTVAATGVSYPNLVLAGSGTKTMGIANGQTIVVLGNLTINNGVTLSETSRNPAISVAGNVTNNGTYTVGTGTHTFSGSFANTGTYTGSSGSVGLGGDFSNSATFTSGSGIWTFQGGAAQNLTGTPTFQNLELNNAAGLSLSGGNVTVSTRLTLTSGAISTGSNILSASASCSTSVSRTGGWVNGNLQLTIPSANPVTCIFHVGDTGNYAPVTFTKTGNNTGTLVGTTVAGDHADTTAGVSGIDAAHSVNRTWSLTPGTLASGTPYTATFQFCAAVGSGCGSNDVDAGAVFGNFIVAKKVSGSWNLPAVGTRTSSSTQATGLSTFGDFAVGEKAGPDHYELSLPTASIACLPTIATVTACADSVSPCTSKYTAVSGATATLAASAGTLAATTVTFDAAGMASTALSYPAAANGTTAAVSLSSVPVSAFNANKCCPDGMNCVVSNSCATTFNTAGFIFSGTAGGAVATIPAQVAGTSSGTYYLRAVKTSTTTQACESALSGASSVNFAYECNDPTTCYGADLMSVNGGSATTITRNNNGSVSSYAPVAMTFDANGNAPFTVNYNDVGKVTLHANKAAGGSLLSALTGASNAFVVKPFGFLLSGIKQTAAPQLANPVAASAADAKFVKAGENFSATVTAVTATGNVAPNYGQEVAAEGVTLTQTLIAPSGGASGSLANPAAFGIFSNGVATGTTFNWSEVGIVTLTPSVADGNYLGAGDTTGTPSANIGRFYPDHFLVSLPALTNRSLLACAPASGFTYAGEQMRATFTLTARNGLSTPSTTQNYTTASSFAKLDGSVIANFGLGAVDLVDAIAPTTATALTANLGLVSSNGSWTSGAGTFTANLSLNRAAAPDGPYESFQLGVLPVDSDGVTLRAVDLNLDTTVPPNGNDRVNVGSSSVRFGRLKLANAYGSDLLDLPVPAVTQYWNSTAFVTSAADNCTTLSSANMSLSYPTGSTLNATNMGVSHISLGGSPVGIFSSGRGILKLTKPGGTLSGKGSVLLTEDLTAAGLPYLQGAWTGATYTQNPSSLATFGVFKGTNEFIYQRENY